MHASPHSHGAAPTSQEAPALPRRAWVWSAIAGCTVAGLIAAAWGWRPSTPALQGGIISPPAPTYDFSLHDQRGRLVRLSAFRGEVVVLTFLYTQCPDTCPLTAERLRQTYERLGAATGHVAFLAVSVDPRGDTPDAVRAFLAAHRVEGKLEYLTGSFADLRRVWAYYYVQSDARAGGRRGSEPRAPAWGRTARADVVDHTSAVYVIDPAGDLRVLLPGAFDAKDLAGDIVILARDTGRSAP